MYMYINTTKDVRIRMPLRANRVHAHKAFSGRRIECRILIRIRFRTNTLTAL